MERVAGLAPAAVSRVGETEYVGLRQVRSPTFLDYTHLEALFTRWLDLYRSARVAPADSGNFEKGSQTLREVYVRGFIVVPFHREFGDAQSRLFGKEKGLDIEREPLGSQFRKDFPCGLASEHLESALSIPKSGETERANE